MKPTHKAIHIAKSHKAHRTSQNLAISMSLPTHGEKNLVANLKEKNIRMKESLCITKVTVAQTHKLKKLANIRSD